MRVVGICLGRAGLALAQHLEHRFKNDTTIPCNAIYQSIKNTRTFCFQAVLPSPLTLGSGPFIVAGSWVCGKVGNAAAAVDLAACAK